MTQYLAQPRERIFVKGYGFLSFAKNMGKNIGRNTSKNLSGKIVRNFLDKLNNLLPMRLKLLQKKQKQLVI